MNQFRMQNLKKHSRSSIASTRSALVRQKIYTLTCPVSTVNEGQFVVFTMNTTNVANGTLIPYTVTGISYGDAFNSSDINGALLTGNFIVYNNQANLILYVSADARTEGSEELIVTSAGQTARVIINDTSLSPTYTLTRSSSTVNEGGIVVFRMTTTNVLNGTVIPYLITGVSSSDIGGVSLAGNFTVNNNIADLVLNITQDMLTEGPEVITVTSAGQTASVTINDTSLSPTYNLTRSTSLANEGDSVTFTINTTNVVNGTNVPYVITGVSSADISGAPLSGNFVINNNTASITLNITADLLTEGPETLTMTSAGKIVSVAIVDSSLTPPGGVYTLTRSASSITEGDTITFNLSTQNVSDGTNVPYLITGISSADINGSPLTGNFIVNSSTAAVMLTTTIDAIFEQETMTMTAGGQTASVVLIDNISLLPTYTLTRSASSVNEGDSITFTLSTTNITNGTNVPYVITGVSTSDIGTPTLSGNFAVNNNTASVTFNIVSDLTTEGPEVLTITSGGQTSSAIINDTSLNIPGAITYNLTSSLNSVVEGNSITFTLNTTNVPNGSQVPYSITGIDSADINGAPLIGNFTIINNTGSVSFNVAVDEVIEQETMTMSCGDKSVSVDIIDDTSLLPTYSLSASSGSVNEGDVVTFKMTTTNVITGAELPYIITGITSADINNVALSGYFTIDSNNTSFVSLSVAADELTEGVETLTLSSCEQIAVVAINDTSIAPVISYKLTSSANTVNEGDSVTFVMSTTGVANGTDLPYIITGIASEDIGGALLSGDFTIANDSASVTFNIASDANTEGAETMTLSSQDQSVSVTINDTSTAPPAATYMLSSSVESVNEGETVTFTMTTTNIPDGTDIPWVILTTPGPNKIDSADINGASLAGNFTINGNSANITFNVTADLLTEGTEQIVMTSQGQTVTVEVNDTSTTPPPIIPVDTDVFAIFDTTSMIKSDGEAASTALIQWFNQFKTTVPNFVGNLYIIPYNNQTNTNQRQRNERWLDWPSQIYNKSVPSDPTWANVGVGYRPNWSTMATPKKIICLAFVDETYWEYHGSSYNGLTNQPTVSYKTDYDNFIAKQQNVGGTGFDFFKGVVYPIVRPTESETKAFLLHAVAAIYGRVLTSAEVDAFYTKNDVTNIKQYITVSNPYNPTNLGRTPSGLIEYGWKGEFNKVTPGSAVFSSSTFGDELTNLLL